MTWCSSQCGILVGELLDVVIGAKLGMVGLGFLINTGLGVSMGIEAVVGVGVSA